MGTDRQRRSCMKYTLISALALAAIAAAVAIPDGHINGDKLMADLLTETDLDSGDKPAPPPLDSADSDLDSGDKPAPPPLDSALDSGDSPSPPAATPTPQVTCTVSGADLGTSSGACNGVTCCNDDHSCEWRSSKGFYTCKQ